MSSAHHAFILILIFLASASFAQDFEPPRPPPLEPAVDFDDLDDDFVEVGEDGFRPPPPPPPPPGNQGGIQPPLFTPGGDGNYGVGGSNSRIKFKIVDGEFWEKGKKRSRGKRLH